MSLPSPITLDLAKPPDLAPELAFAPLHKRALGTAVGIVCGTIVLIVTLVHVALSPEAAPKLGLLAEYFYGYSVSVRGAVVGLLWGFFTGFVAGWFLAFTRNLAIATSVFITRTRAELDATREFLDHI